MATSFRLAELFGHEAAHAVFDLNDKPGAVDLQKQLNERDAAMAALPKKNRYKSVPPEVQLKMDNARTARIPSERYAQQQEKIINGELRASQKKGK